MISPACRTLGIASQSLQLEVNLTQSSIVIDNFSNARPNVVFV